MDDMTDIDIEFEHLYLEVKAERWHMLERFLLSYFCFREGYVTRNGKPSWELAREQCPSSSNSDRRNEGVLEPLVPLDTIVGEIKRHWRDGELSPSRLRRILDDLLHYAVISAKEKSALKAARLNNAMPPSWYRDPNQDIHCRFHHIGIALYDD